MKINWTSIFFKETSRCDGHLIKVVGVADKDLMEMNPTNRDGFVLMPMSDFKALKARIDRLERLQKRTDKVLANQMELIRKLDLPFR